MIYVYRYEVNEINMIIYKNYNVITEYFFYMRYIKDMMIIYIYIKDCKKHKRIKALDNVPMNE